ncbi:hypothetical protein FPV67DRAFT_1456547 [Lyophyllum atratum]|nr:hypothetical protein FPV67DRAFT_1456547 [Lyophyllum atratum]
MAALPAQLSEVVAFVGCCPDQRDDNSIRRHTVQGNELVDRDYKGVVVGMVVITKLNSGDDSVYSAYARSDDPNDTRLSKFKPSALELSSSTDIIYLGLIIALGECIKAGHHIMFTSAQFQHLGVQFFMERNLDSFWPQHVTPTHDGGMHQQAAPLVWTMRNILKLQYHLICQCDTDVTDQQNVSQSVGLGQGWGPERAPK